MLTDRITAVWTGFYQDLWILSSDLDRVPKRVLEALWIHHGAGIFPCGDPSVVASLIMSRIRTEMRGAERRFRTGPAFDETSFARYAGEVRSIHDRWSLRLRSLVDMARCA